ncbi:MAG: YCF48-related protein [Pirellulales bacterium]
MNDRHSNCLQSLKNSSRTRRSDDDLGHQHVALAPIALTLVGLLLATISFFAGSPLAWAEPPLSPADMILDAELADVFFLDPERGWAVGDRGAIWATEDGGATWNSQESPLGCRWESVFFTDSRNGWIVGGWHQPGTLEGRGAILRTRDGGQNWMPIPANTLPALHGVKFHNEQEGWAFSDPSSFYPSGLFRSNDGGRSWAPVPSNISAYWLSAAFPEQRSPQQPMPDGKRGERRPTASRGAVIVAGRDGRVAVATPEGLVEVAIDESRGRHIRQVAWSGDGSVWLVGDEGLVMQSKDGGLQWASSTIALPASAARMDWRCVATQGKQIWVAGDPGSSVLHSGDGGQTWELQRTGQNVPLHSIFFLDAHHGWAVGSLGTILTTRDGGRSWRKVRSGGRTPLVGVFADERGVPWELFAQASGNDGYLSALEFPFRRDVEAVDVQYGTLEARLQAASISVGASSGRIWPSFPVRQRGLRLPGEQIVSLWDQMHGGQGFELLVETIVRKLRTWRPDIVVTDDASGENVDPLAALTRQAVLVAVQRASEPQEFPAQLNELGLMPWRVKKVFGYQSVADRASVSLPATQLAARWSRPIGDIAARSRELVASDSAVGPSNLGFRLLMNPQGAEISRRDVMEGVAIPSGGEGRRDVATTARGDGVELARLVQKQRVLQQLLMRGSEMGGTAGAAWLAQLDSAAQGLGKQTAGDLYWQVGRRFQETGQHELAAESWQHLATRFPHHDFADAALLRLFAQQSSAEIDWRRRRTTRDSAVQSATAAVMPLGPIASPPEKSSPASVAASASPRITPPGTGVSRALGGMLDGKPQVVRPVAATDTAEDVASGARQLDKLTKLLESSRPTLVAEPQWRLTRLAWLRTMDRRDESDVLLRAAGRTRVGDPWTKALADEAWLSAAAKTRAKAEDAPRPLVELAMDNVRPKLDGKLDDLLWSQAANFALTSELHDDEAWTANAKLARDKEFLYLAAICQKPSGRVYGAPSTPRPRDADLSLRDRVEFYFDVDRDYATAFYLACDERGWTRETCAGDASWNPTWYVAVQTTDEHWIIEAAIPWDELTAGNPIAGTVWGLGVQRIVPGQGIQSWSRPAGVVPQGAGWGWLQFP